MGVPRREAICVLNLWLIVLDMKLMLKIQFLVFKSQLRYMGGLFLLCGEAPYCDGGIVHLYISIIFNPIVHKFSDIALFVISVYYKTTALIRTAVSVTRFLVTSL